ncbi:hypothetical protein GCM10022236_34710 [Microlunatus ginsengisoli]|uniref:AAA family ATPase n=1 Tax=Microlunatus ginsengisoli TaxID=363863 RepID=A0ABP7ACU1_9ACTN
MNRQRPARLGVRLLGAFALDGTDLADLRSRKARLVLAVLGLAEGAPVSNEALIDAVWPDDLPADPSRDLAVLVSRGRALVGADRLVRSTGGYALLADWWDRAECEALIRAAAGRRDAGDLGGARAAIDGALSLVRGPLLAHEPDAPWAAAARAATTALIAEARQIAAETALAAGQVGEAAAQARAALEHDPYDESAARILMRAQVGGGRPATALATYARLAERLADDLGVDPAPATRTLHEQILREEPVLETAAPQARPDPLFVGRDRELAGLDAALSESRSGARVVVVLGEPGAGKTALLERWAAAARRRGAIVLTARAEDHDLALQPVLDALAGYRAGRGSPPALGRPAEPADRGLPGPGATTAALQQRAFDDVGAVLDRIVCPHGLVLVVDDLQSADPRTRAWLGHILRRRAEHRLLVLGAANDPALALPPDAIRLALPPLDLADVRAMVGAARAAEVYARSGGNALLVTELSRSADDLPGTVRAAVAERLAATGEAATTLRTAAVLGPRIDLELLAGVLDTPALTVLDHLDEGVRRAFLVEHDAVLTFRHDLIRSAVAADTGGTRRSWIHRRAAAIIAERPDPAPQELIRHARLGGDVPTLVGGLVIAADLARARLDLPGADALLSEALAAANTPELHLRRARIRLARSDLDGADADAQAAMAGDSTGEALELRAWAARNRHDTATAIRLGTAGAAAATDPGIKASCLIAVALAHRGRGELRLTDDLLTEAAGLNPPTAVGMPAWTGILRVHQGRPAEALSRLEPLLGAEPDRGLQGYWVEHTLQMTAHAYGMVGRPAEALAVLDRLGLELDRRGTGVRYAGVTETYGSWILRNLGAPQATDLARAGLARAGSTEIWAQCHLDLADGLLRDGDLDEAAAHLREAVDATAERWFTNRWRFDQRADVLLARLALSAADPGAALEPATRVRDAAEDRGDRRYRAIGGVLLATALARAGQAYDAEDVRAQLAVLPQVAALEAWWLAADLAVATGSAEIRSQAAHWVDQLIVDAGEHGDALKRAARLLLG